MTLEAHVQRSGQISGRNEEADRQDPDRKMVHEPLQTVPLNDGYKWHLGPEIYLPTVKMMHNDCI